MTIALFALCALLITRLDEMGSQRVEGSVTINDGDTITQGGTRIRLLGIDAFEIGQQCRVGGAPVDCGRQAHAVLVRLIDGNDVICSGSGRDRYGRLLAICYAGGRDLNREMVASGWAVAYGDYENEEARARQARRGAWAGEFDQPQAWRATRGSAGDVPHAGLASLMSWLRHVFRF